MQKLKRDSFFNIFFSVGKKKPAKHCFAGFYICMVFYCPGVADHLLLSGFESGNTLSGSNTTSVISSVVA